MLQWVLSNVKQNHGKELNNIEQVGKNTDDFDRFEFDPKDVEGPHGQRQSAPFL